MNVFTEVFAEIWKIWKEIFSMVTEFIPKAFRLIIWVICGLFILPCVFVAGHLYPQWSEWGEGF